MRLSNNGKERAPTFDYKILFASLSLPPLRTFSSSSFFFYFLLSFFDFPFHFYRPLCVCVCVRENRYVLEMLV